MGSLEIFGGIVSYKPVLVAIVGAIAIAIIAFLGAMSGRWAFLSEYRKEKKKVRVK